MLKCNETFTHSFTREDYPVDTEGYPHKPQENIPVMYKTFFIYRISGETGLFTREITIST